MGYLLRVTSGPDEGRTFRIEAGENVIGRSPSSRVVLHDESVAWEHALIALDDGRMSLRNLSALGTSHKGRRISSEVPLHPNDEIELSEKCSVVVRQQAGSVAAARLPRAALALVVVVGLAIVGGAASMLLGSSELAKRPVTAAHWRQAYHRLDERMSGWSRHGAFPAAALATFREAWRLEQARNPRDAAGKWDELRSWLLATPLPAAGAGGPTVAEAAGATPKALKVVMGWDLHARSTDFAWNSDQTYADALVWFVRYRARITHDESDQRP